MNPEQVAALAVEIAAIRRAGRIEKALQALAAGRDTAEHGDMTDIAADVIAAARARNLHVTCTASCSTLKNSHTH